MGDWNEIDFAFLFDILHFYWGIFDIKSAKPQFAKLLYKIKCIDVLTRIWKCIHG